MDWDGARVMVTGSKGFLGKPLVRALEEQGASVFQYDIENGGDVLRKDYLRAFMAGARLTNVFHLAGNSIVASSNDSPYDAIYLNAVGTLNVLEACRGLGLKSVVCSSSNHVYGRADIHPTPEWYPMRHYGAYSVSKVAADYFVQHYARYRGVPAVALRHTNAYGPSDIHDSHIVRGTVLSLLRGEAPVIRSKGLTEKGYLHVDDVVDAYLVASDAPANGIYALNASSNKSYSAVQIVNMICALMESPIRPVILGAETDEDDEFLDSELIESLGWKQHWTLEDGLRDTIAAMRQEAVPA